MQRMIDRAAPTAPGNISPPVSVTTRGGGGETSRGGLYPVQGMDFLTAAVMTRCMGERSIEPVRPVECPLDVLAQQITAAVAADDWNTDDLFGVSRIDFDGEGDAAARLQPFVDGVVLEYGTARGTFLPQVWEDLPDPASFLKQLKRKAGLPSSFWGPEVRLYRYSVFKWIETEAATTPILP